jgi:hypothetical protein
MFEGPSIGLHQVSLSPHYNHNTNRKQNTIVASASSKDK